MLQYTSFYHQLRSTAESSFPRVKEVDVAWEHLVSPYALKVPNQVFKKAETAIRAFYRLSRQPSYQAMLKADEKFAFPIKNDSVLMAYDFHTSATGEAHLVEINTNASGYLFSMLTNCIYTSEPPAKSNWAHELKRSFEQEGATPGCKIAIVDDQIPEQKMYSEFLMYHDLFVSWGWKPTICEASEITADHDFDFIYNRSTDFYLEQPEHQGLRDTWRSQTAVVSPQPREYFLLADKERLIDFTTGDWLKKAGASEADEAAIQSVLIPTYDKKDFPGGASELWSKRRSLFFKPKHAYGGKSVYRGESVSKKVFDRLMNEDILVQKFVPASPVPDVVPGDPLENWKFDVRFYVYRDQIQQVVARLYQGQVTNFASPLGGFTRIEFV